MPILPTVTVGVLLVAALLIAIFKGSRPPQPIPTTPTASNQAALAAIVPVVCALISYATLQATGSYLTVHLAPPKPWIMPMRVGMLLGGIVPWFVGIYFAYKTARAANKGLRAIGAVELLACSLYGAVLLFASTFGFG
jgi:hypothetical protein